MGTVVGRYVRNFADADLAMLDGVSLNAPYPFFWLTLLRIERAELVCEAAGKEHRLPWRTTKAGDRATIVMPDPVFGPTTFEVHPFLQSEGQPIVPQLALGLD